MSPPGLRASVYPALLYHAGMASSFEHTFALETYMLAVQQLVGTGEIKGRLEMAYRTILPLPASQMPEHLREKHETLKQALTWVPIEEPGEPSVVSTLRAMAGDEADRLAKNFFEIYLDLDSAYHTAHGF